MEESTELEDSIYMEEDMERTVFKIDFVRIVVIVNVGICFICVYAVSDQESEPAAAAEEEVVPVKLEEELERFVSQATQTAAGVTEVASEGKEGGEGDDVKVEEEPPQVQITASLGEVRYICKLR